MTSTIRIQAHQAKAGDVRILPDIPVTRRTIKSVETLADGTVVLDYTQPGSSANLVPDKTIVIELPETHPIAVLERMRNHMEEQAAALRKSWVDAIAEGDQHWINDVAVDKARAEGMQGGLNIAIQELRAGVEAY